MTWDEYIAIDAVTELQIQADLPALLFPPGIILGMGYVNDRRRYIVMSCLIGWAIPKMILSPT